MRMWMLPVETLCQKHLLGEHGEIHKHRHNFEKKHSITGRISPIVQIEPLKMTESHDDIAFEMKRRGLNHNSEYIYMPSLDYLSDAERNAKVNRDISKQALHERCKICKERWNSEIKAWAKHGT
jgi:hypothetical protein